tara:strand:+ start:1080 stop:1619 length:540 start_codon:yes stop_codon:yes gene_type:complete
MHKYKYEKYYFINVFDTNLIKYQDKKTNIIYRNYKSEINIKKILHLRDFCKKKGCKFYLSNNIKLALKLNLDGAYIPSFNKDFRHLSYNLKKKFRLLGSAHSFKEIRIKEKQRINSIFLSSIFKKNKNYLGLYKFKLMKNYTNSKIVALGGIDKKNLRTLKLTNVSAFSGISFFKKKAP